jgi:hypothetical protein
MYGKCGSIEDAEKCSTGCAHGMWLPGVPWFKHMWNVGKDRRH